MSSTPFANLELDFRPPWVFLGLLGAWLVALAVVLIQLDWALVSRLFLAFVALSIGGSGLAALATGFAPGAVEHASWLADGSWKLVLRNGRTMRSWLAADTRCWSALCILVWDDGTTQRRALVSRSSTAGETFRRLRIRMRFRLPCDLSPSRKM